MRLRTNHCPHIAAERKRFALFRAVAASHTKKEQTVQLWIVVEIIKFSLYKTETVTNNKKFWDEL
jgi:hypothetical protein